MSQKIDRRVLISEAFRMPMFPILLATVCAIAAMFALFAGAPGLSNVLLVASFVGSLVAIVWGIRQRRSDS